MWTRIARNRRGSRPRLVARAALVGAAVAWGQAARACDGADGVRCLPQADVLTSIVGVGPDFAAVGSAARDGVTQPVLLRLSASGDVLRTIALPWPLGRPPEPKAVAEARRLVALPRGDMVVIGQAWYPGEPSAASWAVRVTETGRVVWSRTFSDPALSIVLVAAAYDEANERVILGGRLTEGADDGQCTKWSQSLVQVLNAATGADAMRPLLRGERGRSAGNREAISDIAPGGGPGRFVVSGFVTVPANRPGRRCLDAMFVGSLAPAGQGQGQGLSLSTLGRLETPGASEVASSIRPSGVAGQYVVAGFRRDQVNEAPAALGLVVRAAPFAVLRTMSTAYPPDRSDRTGSDQFRVALPLPRTKEVLFAGFASSGRDPRRAMWQAASPDLQQVALPTIAGTGGTDVFDAAANAQGSVLLAGRWSDATGRGVAFVRPLGAAGGVAATGLAAGPGAGPAGLRPPEARLPDIATLPLVDGSYRIPPAAVASGGGWAGGQLPAGGQVSLALRLAERRTVKVSFATDRGEADLLVLDEAGRPVAFSNFGGAATEMLIATLPAGEYSVRLLPHVGAGSYQVRLAPAQEIPVRAIGMLQRLSEERRASLAQDLAAAGYASAPEPAIALGAETVRSLLAEQERAGARRAVGPDGIGRTLATLVEGAR